MSRLLIICIAVLTMVATGCDVTVNNTKPATHSANALVAPETNNGPVMGTLDRIATDNKSLYLSDVEGSIYPPLVIGKDVKLKVQETAIDGKIKTSEVLAADFKQYEGANVQIHFSDKGPRRVVDEVTIDRTKPKE